MAASHCGSMNLKMMRHLERLTCAQGSLLEHRALLDKEQGRRSKVWFFDSRSKVWWSTCSSFETLAPKLFPLYDVRAQIHVTSMVMSNHTPDARRKNGLCFVACLV